MAARVTFAELFGRRVAIDWFEAVSMVRGLCDTLSSRGDGEVAVPELPEMAITSDGEIDVLAVTAQSEPLRRFGQLLQALLGSSQPPATLRLVIADAMAAPPVYKSLSEFDAALAYFERPDRREVLRSVFERASAVSPDVAVATPDRLDDVVPLPVPVASRRIHPRTTRKGIIAAICVGILLALATTAVQMIRRDATRRAALTAATERVGARLDRTVLSGVSAVTEWAGLGKLTANPAPTAAAVTSPAAKTTQRVSPGTGAVRGAPPQRVPLLEGFDLLQPGVAAPVSMPPVEPVVASAPERPLEPDVRVYSPEDTSVRPPVAIRPQLPSELPPGVTADQLTRFELVIATDGTVESVRLLPGARSTTVNEAMMLSAAKAWRFSPATRGDQAVRYRKTVWIRQL